MTGDVEAMCYENKVHGQSRSRVLRFSGSGVEVPCGHSQIFGAAQVWQEMSQTLVLGPSFEQLVWQGQLGLGSSGLPVWAAYAVQVVAVQVVLLRSIVKLEPAVWQLCHLGQCCLL